MTRRLTEQHYTYLEACALMPLEADIYQRFHADAYAVLMDLTRPPALLEQDEDQALRPTDLGYQAVYAHLIGLETPCTAWVPSEGTYTVRFETDAPLPVLVRIVY